MVLLRLHRLAQRLLWLRLWCMVLSLLGIVLVAMAVMDNADRHDTQLRFGMVLTLWALMFLAFIQCFQQIPAPVLPKDALYVRIQARLRLWFYQGLVVAVALLGVILLATSLKLLATD